MILKEFPSRNKTFLNQIQHSLFTLLSTFLLKIEFGLNWFFLSFKWEETERGEFFLFLTLKSATNMLEAWNLTQETDVDFGLKNHGYLRPVSNRSSYLGKNKCDIQNKGEIFIFIKKRQSWSRFCEIRAHHFKQDFIWMKAGIFSWNIFV